MVTSYTPGQPLSDPVHKHLGLTRVSPWNAVKVIRTYRVGGEANRTHPLVIIKDQYFHIGVSQHSMHKITNLYVQILTQVARE